MEVVRHTYDWPHLLYDLGRVVFLVALVYAIIVILVKLATRSNRSRGRGPQKPWDGNNRQRHRLERSMSKRKRRH